MLAGTRPEVIKLSPVYVALKKQAHIIVKFCTSGQHDTLVLQALEAFGITPDCRLTIQRKQGPNLAALTSELVFNLSKVFETQHSDLVVVHGDTTTAFCGALAAFYNHIPVAHVEAGLRTARFENPFPEEMHRRLIAQMTKLHFAPTPRAAENLRNEGIDQRYIYCTGNTVVDALRNFIMPAPASKFQYFGDSTQLLLVTCHRRESWDRIQDLCNTVLRIMTANPLARCVWITHPNPLASTPVYDSFKHHPNVKVLPPLPYKDFVHVMAGSDVILTDSGGIIEEASVLGKPLVIMRQVTERPEALELPNVALVGYDFERLFEQVGMWLNNPVSGTPSYVFGDGMAGKRIAGYIADFLGGVYGN